MSYYATPRDEWPTRIEAAQEPPLTPISAEETTELIRAWEQLNGGAA